MSLNFQTIRMLLAVGAFTVLGAAVAEVRAQAGLRASLERLDKNENGLIEPDEITPLARPYLERLARFTRSGLELDEPNDISQIQEVARRYYAVRNGASRNGVRVPRESKNLVLPFGKKPNEPLIPEFGLARVKFPYTQDDLDFADRTLRSHDENKDGYIDRDEASRHEWTHRNPFSDDLNKDDRLSRLEMAQRYARRRLLDASARQLRTKSWREREMQPRSSGERNDLWRRGSDYYLTGTLIGRFDYNRNGILEPNETANLGLPIARIDEDRDGELSRDELYRYLKEEQANAGEAGTDTAPEWFAELDADQDGQVAMPEYAEVWTNAKLEEFAALDVNGDGLITLAEAQSARPVGQEAYHNEKTQLLPPRQTVISEIEVSEDFLIGDLNVQISITHSNDNDLDAFLAGPDGKRIELFTAVGGSGNHFDNTVFDDQSREPITKGRPPYRGAFAPEGLLKGQPGLGHFNGKRAKGPWQLIIRGERSSRYGVLHEWRLLITPQGRETAEAESTRATAPAEEDRE